MAAFEVIALDTATPQLRAPGAADTYTFPRAVELPLGTANGVLYLNGSKVVTSGSGLTFDGTNLGVGTSFPKNNTGYATLTLNNATNGGVVQFCQADTTVGQLFFDGSNAVLRSVTNIPLVFGINNTEQMRLTSTGLGIGTNNPTEKLTVSGGAAFSRIALNSNPIDTVSTTQSFIRFQSTGGDFYVGTEASTGGAFFPSSTAYAAILYNANATPMQFYTAAALRATLDTSGNLGLGVTPSAWSGLSGTAFQTLGGGAIWSLGADDCWFSQNAYENSGRKYIQSFAASAYQQRSGSHRWFISTGVPSAGSPISFTQAMTLDASGNLLVGTTSSTLTNGGVRLRNNGGNIGEIALANNSGIADYVARFLWGATPTLVGNITVDATSTAYNTSSDARLKENITDADPASDLIDAIQIRQFDWKSNGAHQRYGMVAQELVHVAPEAVTVPTDTEEMMAVDYSKLVPMLIKEIQSLRARVAAIEA